MSESGIKYGFPNPQKARPNITFQQRCDDAKRCECSYAHLPLDLIKNDTEINKIGIEKIKGRGDLIPRKEDIPILYSDIDNVGKTKDEVDYVFHLEPGFKFDLKKIYETENLRKRYVDFIISVAEKVSPIGFVIHPGGTKKERDSSEGLKDMINLLGEKIQNYIQDEVNLPWVGIENRSKQRIYDEKTMINFFDTYYSQLNYPNVGIVGDISQAFTEIKNKEGIENFVRGITKCKYQVYEWHIHNNHGDILFENVSKARPIPWPKLMKYFKETKDTAKFLIEMNHGSVSTCIENFEKLFKEKK